jgi:hypothetical protein
MSLTSAEKQARYRDRHVVVLTADAHTIAAKLLAMDDQTKLAQIATLLRDRIAPRDGRCRWVRDDGGRKASRSTLGAGRKDNVGDCVTRAIAIATGKPYGEVHDALTVAKVRYIYAGGEGKDAGWTKHYKRRGGVRAFDPDHGCADGAYGPYLGSLGWRYTDTKGRRLHLRADQLPGGRLIVEIRRHIVAVIDGVIHDTHDCGREGRVPVQGYWRRGKS